MYVCESVCESLCMSVCEGVCAFSIKSIRQQNYRNLKNISSFQLVRCILGWQTVLHIPAPGTLSHTQWEKCQVPVPGPQDYSPRCTSIAGLSDMILARQGAKQVIQLSGPLGSLLSTLATNHQPHDNYIPQPPFPKVGLMDSEEEALTGIVGSSRASVGFWKVAH